MSSWGDPGARLDVAVPQVNVLQKHEPNDLLKPVHNFSALVKVRTGEQICAGWGLVPFPWCGLAQACPALCWLFRRGGCSRRGSRTLFAVVLFPGRAFLRPFFRYAVVVVVAFY